MPSRAFALSVSLFPSFFFLSFSSIHPFSRRPRFLPLLVFLTLPRSLRGGWGFTVVERDEFLIAVGQRGALLLVRVSQGGEAKARKGRKGKKKKTEKG